MRAEVGLFRFSFRRYSVGFKTLSLNFFNIDVICTVIWECPINSLIIFRYVHVFPFKRIEKFLFDRKLIAKRKFDNLLKLFRLASFEIQIKHTNFIR